MRDAGIKRTLEHADPQTAIDLLHKLATPDRDEAAGLHVQGQGSGAADFWDTLAGDLDRAADRAQALRNM